MKHWIASKKVKQGARGVFQGAEADPNDEGASFVF
jgi:hypothetical protein